MLLSRAAERRLLCTTLVLFVLATACGGSGSLSLNLSMSQALLEEVDSVSVLVFGAEVTCTGLVSNPEAALSQPWCEDESSVTCIHARRWLARHHTEDGADLYIRQGIHHIFGVAFNDNEDIVATGCNGPLEIEEGKLTRIRMTLE